MRIVGLAKLAGPLRLVDFRPTFIYSKRSGSVGYILYVKLAGRLEIIPVSWAGELIYNIPARLNEALAFLNELPLSLGLAGLHRDNNFLSMKNILYFFETELSAIKTVP